MIKGLGTDIVEVGRIERSLEKQEFIDLVFTPFEANYCRTDGSGFQSFAGRFAAKEALLKALGTGWAGAIKWNEMEVYNDAQGKPLFRFFGGTQEVIDKLNGANIHLTISHAKAYATATVIIEQTEKR